MRYKTSVRATLRLDGNAPRPFPFPWRNNDEVSGCDTADLAAIAGPVVPQFEDQGFIVE